MSLACHASLMLALRLSYLRVQEKPSYDYLPVRVLMVDGEDVSVTQAARDTFSVPTPPSASDTSLDDEKAAKQEKPEPLKKEVKKARKEVAKPKEPPKKAAKQEKPELPKRIKPRKEVAKPEEPPEKAEPQPAPPTKTSKKERKAKKSSSSPTEGGAARRPVPVGMQGQEKQALRLIANPPPSMPDRAWYEGRFGTTWVRVFVSATGAVDRVEVAQSSGHRDLDAVALRHVRTRFRFTPAMVHGKPVAARCQVYVQFPRSR